MSFLSPPPPPNFNSSSFNLSNKVSPSVLLIIIILAIIFFISGLLHLLIRVLLRPPTRVPDEPDNVTALQGQLQQLFHLHDAGVDQSFIDTLPVFNYKAIIGSKDPFDCAVCLCEFEPEDKLRLLPKCSHAFHMECIDTWLLSHSTCPLCRSSLLADFSSPTTCSPIVLVLESGSESSREIVFDRDGNLGRANSVGRANTHLGFHYRDEIGSTRIEFGSTFGSTRVEISGKSSDIPAKEEVSPEKMEKIVPVKLGKFRKVDEAGEGSSTGSNDFDARRCLSMGSFAYILDENLDLQVPIRTQVKKQPSKKRSGHRLAMSECDCESRRDFSGFEPFKSSKAPAIESERSVGGSKRESFSVSKIWLRGKEKKSNPTPLEASRRAFSFRFPVNGNFVAGEETKAKEIGLGSELGCDEENLSHICLDSQPKTPSFARTLLWLMGRQNKVVHSSSSPNV
ncbi:hypothetical protein NMG60_11005785 [Bertholletia excelsa]